MSKWTQVHLADSFFYVDVRKELSISISSDLHYTFLCPIDLHYTFLCPIDVHYTFLCPIDVHYTLLCPIGQVDTLEYSVD